MTVELITRSCFSLRHGASSPTELVERAAELGYTTLGLVDRDGVYGSVEAHQAAKAAGIHVVHGATVRLAGYPAVAVLVQTVQGWANLCQLLTLGHQRAPKGWAEIELADLLAREQGLELVLRPGWAADQVAPLQRVFGERLSVLLRRVRSGVDRAQVQQARELSASTGIPLLASQDVLYHAPERGQLADILTCIRRGCTVEQAGRWLDPNRERTFVEPEHFAARFADVPGALQRAHQVAARCVFSMDQLAYRYPREVVPDGYTAMEWLRELTWQGLDRRYPGGAPSEVLDQIHRELDIIHDLDFPSYFLTVYDIVRFAREQGILCQGRGSAANSAVCYVLGITAVDPSRASLLFERFISRERGEPPDIDVDFEHERREEVIQYIYSRYGRHRAAMVCNVITWRPRSAVRDVGKALGLSLDQVDTLAKALGRSGLEGSDMDRAAEAGLRVEDRAIRLTLQMARELCGLPRHLGIHSGGFVISDQTLTELVPVEPASMEGRTVIQWDKYGVEALGFVKVDVLALGMLTAIRRAFDLVAGFRQTVWSLATVPPEDPAVYTMFQKADTIGIFQIESRAQMSMLPRLKPACFYDLVIEVAIVRPGPIQGGMVHPYLRRRRGDEPVRYPHVDLEPVLSRTLGVPLFQEQVMAIAIVAGGFSAGQADELRRAMGAWRKRGTLDGVGQELVEGMRARGITAEFCEAILQQVKGFGEYGFPESHAASFALLVYASGWLKCREPAAFATALINSQPMGFYSPRAILEDARRHGVELRPLSVQDSEWDCTLEPDRRGEPAIRLGLRLVGGLKEADADTLVRARQAGPFRSIGELAVRSGLGRPVLLRLARAGVLADLEPDRRQAIWAVQSLWEDAPLFMGLAAEDRGPFEKLSGIEKLVEDYATTGLSLHGHPAAAMRRRSGRKDLCTSLDLFELQPGERVSLLGLVSSRQRPGTAKGVYFLAMEDETGLTNVIVWPKVWSKHRKMAHRARLMGVDGTLQRDGDAISILAERLWAVGEAPDLRAPSRNFR